MGLGLQHIWAKFRLRVLFTVIGLQLFYWLMLNPTLFVAAPTPVKLPVSQVMQAQIASPDLAGLAKARFEPVTLPWDGCCQAGYRAVKMQFTLSEVPDEGLALVPNLGSDNYRIYINGSLLFGDGDMVLPQISYHGSLRATLRIPPVMLHRGDNELLYLLVRDPGTPFFSVGKPAIGDFATISRAYFNRNYSLGSYLTMSQGIGFAAALLAFILWLRSKRDPTIFWMAVLCMAWALRIMHHRTPYPLFHGEMRIILLYAYVNMVPVALLNFANHWTGFPNRWITRLSLGFYGLSVAMVAAIVGLGLFNKIDTADRMSMAMILVVVAVIIGLFVIHYVKHAEKRHWEVAIFVLCAILIGHDAYANLFDGDYGDHVKRALPVVLLGFIAPFFAGNVRLFRSMGDLNLLLQGQLTARTAELELAHAREKDMVRETAHLNERKRLMRDMHDGLGSQLMSMLLMARRGEAKPVAVAEGLQAVVDEMRLMIDSMDSVGDSLTAALLIFRDRLRARVQEAGLRMEWSDRTQGVLPDYGPRDVLQIFRIMQEAVANALKHSGGSLIAVHLSVGAVPDSALRIEIADDGRGMGVDNPRGRGLGNMEMRAEAVGAKLHLHSDQGLRVVLDLPDKAGVAK
ncbi:MAG: hypothetical protein RLY97_1070 [Pseudomonadota bacterium]|jgi:signal transduction histidine kinase